MATATKITITPGRTWVTAETVTAAKLNSFLTAASVDASFLDGALSGFGTSNGTDASHDIDFAPGTATDVDGGSTLQTTTTFTKQIDAVFAEGTALGGLDTGAVAIDTWYHMFAIGKTDGTVDFLFSTSATAPTMPTGFTLKRRIGSILTDGSANIFPYTQINDVFMWDDPILDSTTTTGSASVTSTVVVRSPLGVSVRAILSASLSAANGEAVVLRLRHPDLTAAQHNAILSAESTSDSDAGYVECMTDTSSQVTIELAGLVSGSMTGLLSVTEWIDTRDKG